jgi:hypothetical protein
MRIVRLLAGLGLVLCLAVPAAAQGPAKDGTLALLYDVDSATLTYCSLRGASGGLWGDEPIRVIPKIKTTGSTTTVDELVTGTNPFRGIVAGDVLVVQTPTTTDPAATTLVAVITHTSDAQIVVDTAINVTGNSFGYFHHACGTTAADGWFAVPLDATRFGTAVQYDQGDLDALVVRWECKNSGPGAEPTIIYPGQSSDCGLGGTLSTDRCSFATAGITARIEIVNTAPTQSFCRVGIAMATTDTSDATTAREKVTIKVAVR